METDGIYYFGNIPSDETFLLLRRRQLHHFKSQHYRLQFQGCLSTIRINNQPIILDSYVNNEYNYNIQACYENEESGIFINGEKEIILGKSFLFLSNRDYRIYFPLLIWQMSNKQTSHHENNQYLVRGKLQ